MHRFEELFGISPRQRARRYKVTHRVGTIPQLDRGGDRTQPIGGIMSRTMRAIRHGVPVVAAILAGAVALAAPASAAASNQRLRILRPGPWSA